MQNHKRIGMRAHPNRETLWSLARPKLRHCFGRLPPHLSLLLLCKWRRRGLFPGGCLYTEALLACLGWA